MSTKKLARDTPLWLRVSHWMIAVLFLALVFTGVVLTFSGSEFAMMDYELATTLHEVTGIALVVFYGMFLVMALTTGYWRNYIRQCHRLLWRIGNQIAYVLRWSPLDHKQAGRTRLDAMKPLLFLCQRFLYLASIGILLPLLIVTGLFYLYPETAPSEVMGFAGLWPMALAHYVVGLIGTLFILFHIYISTMKGLSRMILG